MNMRTIGAWAALVASAVHIKIMTFDMMEIASPIINLQIPGIDIPLRTAVGGLGVFYLWGQVFK